MQDLSALLSNHCVQAASVALAYEDLPPERVLQGPARVGTAELGALGDCTVGVWEITPSVSTDVESEEFFIVLDGEATVRFADGSPDMVLRAGTVGRLAAGAATTWTVTRTLRKIYLV
jgi:uncharacterized cupin superfamily protein